MIVTFEDEKWELNLNRLSYQQALAIQLETGLSIAEFEKVLDVEEDENGQLKDPGPKFVRCIGCVYWLMHNQNGDVFPLAGMDFDFAGFLAAMGEAMQAELERIRAERAEQDAEPDPTVPSRSPKAARRSPGSGSRKATTPAPRGEPPATE